MAFTSFFRVSHLTGTERDRAPNISPMPAKRSSRTSVARSGQASSSTLPPADDLGQPIKGALETWGSGGQDVLRDLVSQQLAADTMVTPLATLPLTNVFLNLLLSEVETEEITTFLVSVFDSISDENKEDHTEALAEALVDVVEVLEESEEDVAQQQAKERSKALGVLGSLIVRSLLAHIILKPTLTDVRTYTDSRPQFSTIPRHPADAWTPASRAQPYHVLSRSGQAEYHPLLQAIEVQPP